MTADEQKAVDILVGEVRAALESVPPLDLSGATTPDEHANQLMLAAAGVLSLETQLAIGNEVVRLLLLRSRSAIELARLRRDPD